MDETKNIAKEVVISVPKTEFIQGKNPDFLKEIKEIKENITENITLVSIEEIQEKEVSVRINNIFFTQTDCYFPFIFKFDNTCGRIVNLFNNIRVNFKYFSASIEYCFHMVFF